MIFWNSHAKGAHIGSSHSPKLVSCLKIKLILRQGEYDHVNDVFFSIALSLVTVGRKAGLSGKRKGRKKKMSERESSIKLFKLKNKFFPKKFLNS